MLPPPDEKSWAHPLDSDDDDDDDADDSAEVLLTDIGRQQLNSG